jgi:hypothetical protein
MVGDDERACLIENPVIRSGALSHRQGWAEAVEHTQAIQHVQASGRGSRAGEVQACDLATGEHSELEAVLGDAAVTLGQMRREPQHILITKPLRTDDLFQLLTTSSIVGGSSSRQSGLLAADWCARGASVLNRRSDRRADRRTDRRGNWRAHPFGAATAVYGTGEQRCEQPDRVALHLRGKALHAGCSETHAIITTYTFIHSLLQPNGRPLHTDRRIREPHVTIARRDRRGLPNGDLSYDACAPGLRADL